MKPLTSFSTRRLLIAAAVALAPAGAALAAQDCAGDPFAAYHQAFRADGPAYQCKKLAPPQPAGAQGPAGPLMAADAAACRNDPFYRVHQALWGDGPEYECVASARAGEGAAARGPAGPIMTRQGDVASDPFYRYHAVFTAD